jgi:hypothetical protein
MAWFFRGWNPHLPVPQRVAREAGQPCPGRQAGYQVIRRSGTTCVTVFIGATSSWQAFLLYNGQISPFGSMSITVYPLTVGPQKMHVRRVGIEIVPGIHHVIFRRVDPVGDTADGQFSHLCQIECGWDFRFVLQWLVQVTHVLMLQVGQSRYRPNSVTAPARARRNRIKSTASIFLPMSIFQQKKARSRNSALWISRLPYAPTDLSCH